MEAELEASLQENVLRNVVITGRELGSGSYGRVIEVSVREKLYAAKEIHPELLKDVSIQEYEAAKKSFLQECFTCKQIHHPNIVQMLGVYYPKSDTAGLPLLVMELMDMSLTQFLKNKQLQEEEVSFSTKISILVDVAAGLQYLHSQNILHRDLSSNNILLTNDLIAKIADLGVAKVVKQSNYSKSKGYLTRAPGTIIFMPHEALQATSDYSKPVDVFSLACVTLHVMSSQWPMPTSQVVLVGKRMKAYTEVERRQDYLKYCKPPDLQELVKSCLHHIPKKRPEISQVYMELTKIKGSSHSSENFDQLVQPLRPKVLSYVLDVLDIIKKMPLFILKKIFRRENSQPEDINEGMLVEKACSAVDEAAAKMALSLSNKHLLDTLKYASVVLGELQETRLSSETYFDLYTYIVHKIHMHPLEQFLSDVLEDGLAEGMEAQLYTLIQHNEQMCVLPRLYMLITISMVYIKSGVGPRKDILNYLEEICNEEQHPLKGLLLRYYLLQRTNTILTDINRASETDGAVDHLVEFILSNFSEMNSLWFLYQEIREYHELDLLKLHTVMGENLILLAKLGIDIDKYKNDILHKIMEQIIPCKDLSLQNFLMDCFIQKHPDMLLEDIIAMLVSMVNFNLKVYPDELENLNQTFRYTFILLQQRNFCQYDMDSQSNAGVGLIWLLIMPLETYEDMSYVLQLEYYPKVLQLFDYQGRKQLAIYLVTTIVERCKDITTPDALELLLTFMSPLIQDQPDQPKEPPDPQYFCEEQWLMVKLVYLLKVDVADKQFKMLDSARKFFGTGGDQRIIYTLPPLVFAAYRLVKTYQGLQEENDLWQLKAKRIFMWCQKTILAIYKIGPQHSLLCLSLFAQGALAADQIKDEISTCDFVGQALSLCKADALDSKAHYFATKLIVSVVQQLTVLGEEKHTIISDEIAEIFSNLAQKADQCRGMVLCAHLFWSSKVTSIEVSKFCDDKKVVEYLKKSGRIALNCDDNLELKAQLLVELLNNYMYFYEKNNGEISPLLLKHLIQKIKQTISRLDDDEEANMIKTHFTNTISHIKFLQSSRDSSHYDDVEVQ